MASKYNIEPGTFETITNQDIGTFVLDEWTHFKLDGYYPFLMANITLKQGTSTIPPSAYELATDSTATAQEAGKTGQTLYGQIRITNVAYVGVTLNISGNNFGSYVSNKATIDYTTNALLTKVAPGSDNFIEAGEPAIFEGSSGLSLISDNSGEIPLWDSGTAYSVAGTLVRLGGITAVATGAGSNQNKNPLLEINSPYWFIAPDARDLFRMANRGLKLAGDMHPINDRASAVYVQNLLLDKRKVQSTTMEYHMIHLDGSTVTGNTTLEALLKVGDADEYPYIDIYAPDELGTRTLIDMGGRYERDQSSASDVVPTIGAIHDDAMQRITGNTTITSGAGSGGSFQNANGAFVKSSTVFAGGASDGGQGANNGLLEFDSSQSTSPNAAKTDDIETKVRSLVRGISSIIVTVAA